MLEDPDDDVRVRIPAIDDLMALKKMREANRKDEEDLRYLQVRKALEEQGRLSEDE